MTKKSGLKSVRQFKGTDKDWMKWSFQFEARANAKNYSSVLRGEVAVVSDSTTIDENTEEGKKQLKARTANRVGYCELLNAVTNAENAFLLVKHAKTTD